jgi:hypothetical protein
MVKEEEATGTGATRNDARVARFQKKHSSRSVALKIRDWLLTLWLR